MMTMNMQERNRLRRKQDRLLALASKKCGGTAEIPPHFRICDDPAAPALSQLRQFIYPLWESEIDRCIEILAK